MYVRRLKKQLSEAHLRVYQAEIRLLWVKLEFCIKTDKGKYIKFQGQYS